MVLVGDEGALAGTAEEARRGGGGGDAVAVVGLDLHGCDEAAVDAAVGTAWRCFDGLDAMVNCYSYEGPYTTSEFLYAVPAELILSCSSAFQKKIPPVDFNSCTRS